MAVVKTVKRVGKKAGSVLDAEDRQFLAKWTVLIGGAGGLIVAGAGIVGLAWRVFGLAAG